MKHDKSIQLPLSVTGAPKRDSRSQYAALPFRIVDDKVQILLVTSRRSKRWILPKGWPEWGMTPAECAKREAYEEAGVKGRIFDLPIGIYSYVKILPDAERLPCLAVVYPMRVTKVLKSYPEQDDRRRKWVTRKKAAAMVKIPELQRIIRTFDPATQLR